MRRYSFVQVDVFTHARFGGNQLAVFTDARGLTDSEMQTIAMEMNYAESTFVLPPEAAGTDARVRIFTTVLEMAFAGHPTVGTAFVLARTSGATALTLGLNIGPIPVEVDAGDGMLGGATMNQPLPTFEVPDDLSRLEVAGLLGLEPGDLADFAPVEIGSAGAPFLFVPLRSRDELERVRGTDEMLDAIADGAFHGVYPYCMGGDDADAAAHVRMFFPASGGAVQEDPATGSAAGPFGAYLVRHGLAAPGSMLIEQGHELGRPSQLRVTVDTAGDEITKVTVGGGVVFVAEGELVI